MKIIILLSLLVLMTTAVFGAVVSEQKIDDLGIFTSSDGVQCEYYSGDNKLYCFSLPFPQIRRVWTYDLDTRIVENKTPIWAGFGWSNNNALWYYNDQMWGLAQNGVAFSYDIVGDTITNLSDVNSNLPDIGWGTVCCAVDEGTDDVYCIGGDNYETFKYEMDTDTFTDLNDLNIPNLERLYMADMCDYDQTRDKLYWVLGNYRAGGINSGGLEVYEYDVAGNSHSLMGSLPNISANPSDPNYLGIKNAYCDYVAPTLYCFTADDEENYQYDDIFYIDVITGISGISDVHLHENISYSSCDRINGTRTLCFGGYYDQDNWYESDDLFEVTYDLPVEIEVPAVEEVTAESQENIGGNIIALQNLQKAQRQAQQIELNPLEQLILRIRAIVLGLFGYE